MVCYYTDDDNANNTEISIDINDLQKDYDLYLLDEDNDYKKIGKYKSGDKLNLKRNSVVLIKSY